MSTITETIKTRISANSYDPQRTLSDQQISDLIELATHAPSAFNLQNWRFVAVRSEEAKSRLLPLAYRQQKIVDAAVTFIICGTLKPHESLPASLQPSVDASILDQATYDTWVNAAQGMYGDNPALQRDEAIRSGSLAAMTLMLAAKGQGLDSTPMIGFDPSAVAEAFGLSANEIPVMLVAVGYAGSSFVAFGAGAVGLAAIMAAKVAGATTIIAVDITPSRLELALELGATHVINSREEDAVQRVHAITGGGANYSLECSGRAKVLRQAIDAITILGTCGIVGATPMGTEVSFNINDVMIPGKRIMGIVQGDVVANAFIPKLVQLFLQDRFPFDKLCKFYPFDEINQAMADSEKGLTIKPILLMPTSN